MNSLDQLEDYNSKLIYIHFKCIVYVNEFESDKW